MTIGARVFKTGLAVAIALWAGYLVGLSSPLLAAIAAIFTIQPSIYRSWMQVLDQIQSNVLGAAAALAAVYLVGSTPIAVGIVCVLVILICIRLRAEEAIGLTLVTVVVIMESHGEGWSVALDRLAALLTGIVAAFAVNVAVAPPQHRHRFVRQVAEARLLLSRLLRTAISNELKENVFRDEQSKLHGMLRKLEDSYRLFAEERVWRSRSRARRARMLVVYKGMLAALLKGEALIEAVEEHYFAAASSGGEAFSRLMDREIESLCAYHEQLLWKWEDKLKPGAGASAPPERASLTLMELIGERTDLEPQTRAKLTLISGAVYAYEDQLRRLDELMEQWFQRVDGRQGE